MPESRTVAIAMELQYPFQWHHGIYAGILRYSRREGHWNCVIDETPQKPFIIGDDERPTYDGIIGRISQPMATSARRQRIPQVNVWFSSPVKNVPHVMLDLEETARICAEHLMERGFRQFGHITLAGRADTVLRQAFVRYVREAGLPCRCLAAASRDNYTPQSWSAMLNDFHRLITSLQPPMGLYVREGHWARQIVNMCHRLGLAVPYDVAIICFENEPAICDNPPPSLSAVLIDWEQIGYEAAALLDKLMDGEPAPTQPLRIPPIGIQARGSTDFTAVEDEIVAKALRYIARHLREPLDDARIASAVATSPRTLRRRFHDHLGRSVAAEIRRLRIELAKRRLIESDQTIGAIALEAGFTRYERLCEVFQRELGLSPGAYRKKETQKHRTPPETS